MFPLSASVTLQGFCHISWFRLLVHSWWSILLASSVSISLVGCTFYTCSQESFLFFCEPDLGTNSCLTYCISSLVLVFSSVKTESFFWMFYLLLVYCSTSSDTIVSIGSFRYGSCLPTNSSPWISVPKKNNAFHHPGVLKYQRIENIRFVFSLNIELDHRVCTW